MKRTILVAMLVVLSACGADTVEPGFGLTEDSDVIDVPDDVDCSDNYVICFEADCIEGHGRISFEHQEPSALSMRNVCEESLGLHWITGTFGGPTDETVQRFEQQGDFTVPYSGSLRPESAGTLSLFRFHLEGGFIWDNDPLNRRVPDFDYGWEPPMTSRQVFAVIEAGATITIEGDPMKFNGDVYSQDELERFDEFRELGFDAVSRVQILVPTVTTELAPVPNEFAAWPIQIPVDEGVHKTQDLLQARWITYPDPQDPRPRELTSVQVSTN